MYQVCKITEYCFSKRLRVTGIILFSMLAGVVAGLLAGLFGIGGGLVLVPMLVMLFKDAGFALEKIMIMAIATSLATVVITSAASIWAHHRLKTMIWRKVFILAPGIMLGAGGGALCADAIQPELLRYLFSIFLLYVGAQMAFQLTPDITKLRESRVLDIPVSIVIGTVSSFLGIGGGTLTVPYLIGNRYAIRNAVAISSACGFPIAVTATVTYAVLGWEGSANLPEGSLGYVYLPAFFGIITCSILTAPIGAKLAQKLPAKALKRYFSLIVFFVAGKLLWL